jgi:hypothetical protein
VDYYASCLETQNLSNIVTASSDLKAHNLKIITDEPTVEDALDFKGYGNKLAEI